jgi:hypothetical protein
MLTNAGDSSETFGWRADQRREYRRRTLRKGGMVSRDGSGMGSGRSEICDEGPKRGQAPHQPQSSPRVKDRAGPAPLVGEHVRKLSPMPEPVVEEPLSDCRTAKGKQPCKLGMASRAADKSRTTTSPAPSPLLDVRSLSASPMSTVSSLHDQPRLGSFR